MQLQKNAIEQAIPPSRENMLMFSESCFPFLDVIETRRDDLLRFLLPASMLVYLYPRCKTFFAASHSDPRLEILCVELTVVSAHLILHATSWPTLKRVQRIIVPLLSR